MPFVVLCAAASEDHVARMRVLASRMGLEQRLAVEAFRRMAAKVDDPDLLRELLVETYARRVLDRASRRGMPTKRSD